MRPDHAGLTRDAAGFVLAGGRSTRMGRDKALVEFRGKPLVAHALGLCDASGLSTSIAGAHSLLTGFSEVIEDETPDLGPLQGICTALKSCHAEYALFLPVDLPLLPVSLIKYMLRHARITSTLVTLSSVNGFAQTFPVVISRFLLPALLEQLNQGRLGCFAAFQAAAEKQNRPVSILPTEVLVQAGQVLHPEGLPVSRWFLNLNSPADLQRAAHRAFHIA